MSHAIFQEPLEIPMLHLPNSVISMNVSLL